jgi:hypothetical protein
MPALRWCIVAALLASLAATTVCVAQPAQERKSADIQVWAIRATTKNKEISPELRDLAEKLKKEFKFTGFKLEQRSSGNAAIGKAYSTSLPGGYRANVTPKSNDGRRVQLQVEVFHGKDRKLNATVTVRSGQFQLFGGLSLDGGDQLILAVSGR